MSNDGGAFVISGAGSGIGQAIAHKLISEGQFVFGLGRDSSKLQKLAGDRFAYCAADLSNASDTRKAVAQIRQTLQEKRLPLRGLVNNAGIFSRQSFQLTSDEVWERFFHNNLLSAVRLTRELFADLQKGKPSSVLNISSSLGVRPVAETSAYSALKAAMINWSHTLALEWASEGIRVNCICPGIVDTPIHPDAIKPSLHALQPLGVIGQPENIADAAWFLLSNSPWTTGTNLVVDGGITL